MYSNVLRHGVTRILLQNSKTASSKLTVVAGIHTSSQKNDAIGEFIQRLRFRFYHDPRHHMDNDKWAKIFTIEGNIKSGKGEFGRQFAERMDLRFFPSADYMYIITSKERHVPEEEVEFLMDPEHIWKRSLDISLDRFYNNPEDWAHMGRYHVNTMRARFLQYADAVAHLIRTGQGVVIERSFFSLPIFEHAYKKMKWLNRDVFKYMYEYRMFMSQNFIPPHAAIYLDVSPEKCLENVKKTGSPAEQKIALEYLKALEEGYGKYLEDADKSGTKVIQFDWENSQDIDEALMLLDNLPSLSHEYNRWDKDNHQLKGILKEFSNNQTLDMLSYLYCPIDEMNYPHWMYYAIRIYLKSRPWSPIGFDKKKDKWLWLKEPEYKGNGFLF